VARKRAEKKSSALSARRTRIVWGAFLVAVTGAVGLLSLNESASSSGFLLANLDQVAPASQSRDSIFQISAPLARGAWTGIVIHHSGDPAGDADSIHRRHLDMGFDGLGYHFLIGNGNGMGDGVVHVGYRWDQQLVGLQIQTPAVSPNERFIHICLVGNGDRRPFTDRQFTCLTNLVQRLQRELRLPASRVFLMRDLAGTMTSPGRYFDAAAFRQLLLD